MAAGIKGRACMTTNSLPATLGELRDNGYQSVR